MRRKEILSNLRKSQPMPETVKHAKAKRVPHMKTASLPHTTEPSPERDSENDNYLSTQSDLNEQRF